MSAEQVLVSVRFHGYYLELLVAKTSTIYELVQAMRDNSFIPANISNNRLIFKKANGQEVQGNMKVTVIVENSDNTIHRLIVEVKPESSLSTDSSGTDFFQSQTNKLLQRIIKYLKSGNMDTLLKAKDNQKLEATMAGHLTTIGKIFLDQKNLIEFLTAGLKRLTQYQQNNMDELFSQSSQKVSSDQMKIVKQLSKVINDLRESKEQVQKKMKDNLNKKLDQLDEVKDELIRFKLKVQAKDNIIKEKQEKIQQLTSNLSTIVEQLTKNKSTLQNNIKQIQISKKFSHQIKIQLQQEQKLVSTKNTQLVKINKKIKQLEQIIQARDQILKQKDQALKKKDEEIKRIKQNGIDQQIDSYYKKLCTSDRGPIKGRLTDIINDKQIVDELKFTIQTQMKKPISQILQLLSYDRNSHHNYVLNRTFQTLIHQKHSLLLIALPQGEPNKFFGAFTEQKYTRFPTSYFIPDFNGRSFLFSTIKKELKHFNIRDGQNSILFDLENLVFGNDDLIIDFDKGICKSKFVEGRSISYNIEPAVKGKDSEVDYRFFMSDHDKKGKQQQEVRLDKYKIYEVRFNDQGKGI